MKGKRPIFTTAQRNQIRREWNKVHAKFMKLGSSVITADIRADNALAKKWGVPKRAIIAITDGGRV